MESLGEGAIEIRCDVCGYSRRGLPAEARCPECGGEPPLMAGDQAGAGRTVADLAWFRSVAVGLWLLIAASIGALQVALFTPATSSSWGIINFPGPKINAAAMVLRSIGGPPGPWGVAGTIWGIGAVVAVWLITEPRTIRTDFEPALSLRRAARWSAVLGPGAVLGYLLSNPLLYIYTHGRVAINLYVLAVGVGELAPNALLYFYLRRLAREAGDGRALAVLDICVWAAPAVIGVGAALLPLSLTTIRVEGRAWRALGAGYEAAALTLCAAATVAVARLAAVYTATAFNGRLRVRSTALPKLLRQALDWLERRRRRACVVAGIVLLLWTAASNFESVAGVVSRQGLGGDVPMLNFAGPKVLVSRAASAIVSSRFHTTANGYYPWPAMKELAWIALVNLAAVWLVTCGGAAGKAGALVEPGPAWGLAARWTATAAVAGSIGFVLARPWRANVSPAHVTAWTSILAEAPATLLLYLYLSRLAAGALRRRLLLLALAAPVLIVVPMAAFAVSASLLDWRGSVSAGLVGGLYTAISLGTSLMAAFALGQLALQILRPARAIVSPAADGESGPKSA